MVTYVYIISAQNYIGNFGLTWVARSSSEKFGMSRNLIRESVVPTHFLFQQKKLYIRPLPQLAKHRDCT